MEQRRILHLLRKTLATLEKHYELSIFDCDLADEIGITTEEYDEIMNSDEVQEENRYMVQMEWAFDGEHDVETFLFSTEKRAQAKFNEIKAREISESWIADGTICDATKEPEDDDIIIETDNDSCFTAYIYGRECETHTRITLSEVKTNGEAKTND